MDLEKLTNDELRALQTKVGNIICERRSKRQKELWGNVIAAIKKYEQEFGTIQLDEQDYNYIFNVLDNDTPGTILIEQV